MSTSGTVKANQTVGPPADPALWRSGLEIVIYLAFLDLISPGNTCNEYASGRSINCNASGTGTCYRLHKWSRMKRGTHRWENESTNGELTP
jgi:hypothetical protein